MDHGNASRRRGHRGVGIVEVAMILAAISLVLYVAVGELGSAGSDSINQTAEGITDPQKILQHPMLAGNSGNSDNDKDKTSKDKTSKDKKADKLKEKSSFFSF